MGAADLNHESPKTTMRRAHITQDLFMSIHILKLAYVFTAYCVTRFELLKIYV